MKKMWGVEVEPEPEQVGLNSSESEDASSTALGSLISFRTYFLFILDLSRVAQGEATPWQVILLPLSQADTQVGGPYPVEQTVAKRKRRPKKRGS